MTTDLFSTARYSPTSELVSEIGFHKVTDFVQTQRVFVGYQQQSEFTYSFHNFFHPFVGKIIERLNRESVRGVLDPGFHAGLAREFFSAFYTAQTSLTAKVESFP